MISRELLSEVLGINIKTCRPYKNLIGFEYEFVNDERSDFINIYELAVKTK